MNGQPQDSALTRKYQPQKGIHIQVHSWITERPGKWLKVTVFGNPVETHFNRWTVILAHWWISLAWASGEVNGLKRPCYTIVYSVKVTSAGFTGGLAADIGAAVVVAVTQPVPVPDCWYRPADQHSNPWFQG